MISHTIAASTDDVPTQLAALLGYHIKRIRITDEKPPRIFLIDLAAAITKKDANHAAQDVGYVNDCLPEVTPILGDFDSAGKARKRRLWQIPVEFTFLSPGRHAAPIPFVAFLPPPVALLSPSCRCPAALLWLCCFPTKPGSEGFVKESQNPK